MVKITSVKHQLLNFYCDHVSMLMLAPLCPSLSLTGLLQLVLTLRLVFPQRLLLDFLLSSIKICERERNMGRQIPIAIKRADLAR